MRPGKVRRGDVIMLIAGLVVIAALIIWAIR
jgi:hypothetical protein